MSSANISASKTSVISRSVLSDGTYERIRSMILEHDIAPGEHISIDGIARELGVSQTPVREALARLEEADLVAKEPLRGYSATTLLSVRQFDELFQFRLVVEPWIAELAAVNLTPEGSDALRAEIAQVRGLAEQSATSTFGVIAGHDERFHTLIANLCGNATASKALVGTHTHLHLYRLSIATLTRAGSERGGVADPLSSVYEAGAGASILAEHELVAEAILDRARVASRGRMFEHIEASRARFEPVVRALAASPETPGD